MFGTKKEKIVDKCRGCIFVDRKAFACILLDNPAEEWKTKAGCWGQLYGDIVYLSGSMDKLDDWRETATKELEQQGYVIVNPLNTKDVYNSYDDRIKANMDALSKCSIVLVDMRHQNTPYIEASMEIREAFNSCKEIIAFGEINRENEYLKYHVTTWYPTLEDAIGKLRYRTHKESTNQE